MNATSLLCLIKAKDKNINQDEKIPNKEKSSMKY
jgi:hypothetical protein